MYWYDDRIEINSPGGPYGEVSAENFGQPGFVAYRNPLVAEAMRVHRHPAANLLHRPGTQRRTATEVKAPRMVELEPARGALARPQRTGVSC